MTSLIDEAKANTLWKGMMSTAMAACDDRSRFLKFDPVSRTLSTHPVIGVWGGEWGWSSATIESVKLSRRAAKKLNRHINSCIGAMHREGVTA